MKSLVLQAPAKINLTLDILNRREDGYHEMDMIMQNVSLCDEIQLEMGTRTGIRVITDRDLPVGPDNLAVSAALKFRKALNQDWENLTIRIDKKIPVCAGTAGGSSDAAAVLRGLNQLTRAGLSLQQLAEIGAQVGSDVPYCVIGGTARVGGRGEIVHPIPNIPDCEIVLCKPDFPISTPQLFHAWDEISTKSKHPDTQAMIESLINQDLSSIGRYLFNSFEEVLSKEHASEINRIRSTMNEFSPLGVCMSGSGPTVFALFPPKGNAGKCTERLKNTWKHSYLTKPVEPFDNIE